MKGRYATTVAVWLTCLAATPTWAQSVKIDFHDGRVTLSAKNAPLQTVLAEWTRLGGTKMVNGERIPGGLVTIDLQNVVERDAIEILLRNVGGYMIAPQRGPIAGGRSTFASILILPTAAVPRPGTPMAAPPTQTFVPPARVIDLNDDVDDDGLNDTGRQGGISQGGRPGRLVQPRGRTDESGMPPLQQQEPPAAPPTPERPTAAPPFGVPQGSTRPGVLLPPPQAPRPQVEPD